MTDWGDYTPGPWEWADDQHSALLHETFEGDTERPPEAEQIFMGVVETTADARLISKAYLIPRLEAALEAYMRDELRIREVRSLLAELRGES